MIKVILDGEINHEPAHFIVPGHLREISDLVDEKASAGDSEVITFTNEDGMNAIQFLRIINYLYTGSVLSKSELNPPRSPSPEDLSQMDIDWLEGFCAGHHLRSNKIMNHCLGIAYRIYGPAPVGMDTPISSRWLTTLLPLLDERQHEAMHEFLVEQVANQWRTVRYNRKSEDYREWAYTFNQFPGFYKEVKAYCAAHE